MKLLGQRLMARDFDRQIAEFQVRVAVLNGFSALGIPVTEAVVSICPGKGELRMSPDLCNRAPRLSTSLMGGAPAAYSDSCKPYANATKIRLILARAFKAAGFPNFAPHRLRKTVRTLGNEIGASPDQHGAWARNLGHKPIA